MCIIVVGVVTEVKPKEQTSEMWYVRSQGIRTHTTPRNPNQSNNHVGDVKNAVRKLFTVSKHHLHTWRISKESAFGGPRQSDSIEKSRCRREKRLRVHPLQMGEFRPFERAPTPNVTPGQKCHGWCTGSHSPQLHWQISWRSIHVDWARAQKVRDRQRKLLPVATKLRQNHLWQYHTAPTAGREWSHRFLGHVSSKTHRFQDKGLRIEAGVVPWIQRGKVLTPMWG